MKDVDVRALSIPAAGWRLFRADITWVLGLMLALIGIEIAFELIGSDSGTGSSMVTLIIWAILLGRFHERALQKTGDVPQNSGLKWGFLWRYGVLILFGLILPVVIAAIVFAGAAQNATTEAEAEAAIGVAIVVVMPILLASLFLIAAFGTVFPAIVDRGKATFRDGLAISKGRRGHIYVRLLVWLAGPNIVALCLAFVVGSRVEHGLFLAPESYVPNLPLMLLAFVNNCISAFGTACGAATFSRVYLQDRDAGEAAGRGILTAD